jgi:acyl-CoA thioester hydrolase
MTSDWPDISGRLTDFGHVLPVRVYFEDTDFSGSVYHAGYLRFMERGRSDFLRVHGVGHRALASGEEGEPISFAVRRMTIDFLRAATIDDLLEVETRVARIDGARLTLVQRVLRGEEVLAEAEVTIAVVNASGKARRIPKSIAVRLARGATQ